MIQSGGSVFRAKAGLNITTTSLGMLTSAANRIIRNALRLS